MLQLLKRSRPSTCRVTVSGSDLAFEVPRNELLLATALNKGVAYPHNCKVGTCGICKTRLVCGEVRPLLDFALSPLTGDEIQGGYILACQAKVLTDLELQFPIPKHGGAALQTVGGVVERCEPIAADVIDLRLRLNAPFTFQAGQWASIGMADSEIRRAYSFHTPPGDKAGTTEVGFYIKRLPGGAFSEWLFEGDRTGVRFQIQGPFGAMGDAEPATHNICVAGSTGLAPILAIVAERLVTSDRSRYAVVFGVHRQEDLFAMDRLDEMRGRWGERLQVLPILSAEPEGSAWTGRRGLVSDVLTDDLDLDFGEANAFLCGAAFMVDACEAKLLWLGVPKARILADRFVATGR